MVKGLVFAAKLWFNESERSELSETKLRIDSQVTEDSVSIESPHDRKHVEFTLLNI